MPPPTGRHRVSNRGMEPDRAASPAPTHPTDGDRLTELEIKLSYAEDLLDALNALVARQQDQIERLAREVAELQRRRSDEGAPVFRSLRDELPPHY